MKNYKLTFCAILILFVTGSAWAYNISPSNVSGRNGDILTVFIKFHDVGNELNEIDACGLTLFFDNDILEFVSEDRSDTILENFYLFKSKIISDGKLQVSSGDFFNPVQAKSDSILLKVNFKVKQNADKNSVITLGEFIDDIENAETTSATFTYIHPPRPPYLLHPINDISVDEDSDNIEISMSNLFADPDNSPITSNISKELLSNNNPSLVSAICRDNKLLLDFHENQFGSATIEIKGISGNFSVTTTFDITVNNVCDGPESIKTIENRQVVSSSHDDTIFLDQYFRNIDNNTPFINITATSSDADLVTTTINGKVLTLQYSNNKIGIANIQYIASSECKVLTNSFTVTVKDPSEIPPELSMTSNVKGIANHEVSVKVSINNNPIYTPIRSIDMRLTYDEDNLELTNATLTGGKLEGLYDINVNTDISYIAINANSELVYGSGEVVTLTFKIKVNAIGTTNNINFEEAFFGEKEIDGSAANIIVKSPPSVSDVTVTVDEDSVFNGDLSIHSSDPDNDPLSYTILSKTINGKIDLKNTSGKYIYTPHLSCNGSDSFIFSVNDSDYSPITGIVHIILKPVNDPPIALDYTLTTEEEIVYSGYLPYTDIDQDIIQEFYIEKNANKGTIVINSSSGAFYYTPNNLKANSQDSFTFYVSDGNATSNTATVNIVIHAIDDPPIISNILDTQKVNKNFPIAIKYTIDDKDTKLNNLKQSLTALDNDLIESYEFSGDAYEKILTIIPESGKSGETSITISVNDGSNTTYTSFNLIINDVHLSIAENKCITAYRGDVLFIPLYLYSDKNLVSNIYMELSYDAMSFIPANTAFHFADDLLNKQEYTSEITTDNGKLIIQIQLNKNIAINGLFGNLALNVSKDAELEKFKTIEFESIKMNHSEITANSGSIKISGFTLYGFVNYHNNKIPVPFVEMTLTGSTGESFTTVTNENGYYSITGLPPDQYNLNANKTDNTIEGISATDLSFIARFVTRKDDLTKYQKIGADASENGEIRSLDTANVALFRVGIEKCMNDNCNHWKFIMSEIENAEQWSSEIPISYSSTQTIDLKSDLNFSITAVKVGEVSGNWNINPEQTVKRKTRKRIVEKIYSEKGSEIIIPIYLNEYLRPQGIDLELVFNSQILKLKDVSLENSQLDYDDYKLIVNNDQPNLLSVLIYCKSDAPMIQGDIMYLYFDTAESGVSNISIKTFSVNESHVNGGFYRPDANLDKPVNNLRIIVSDQNSLVK